MLQNSKKQQLLGIQCWGLAHIKPKFTRWFLSLLKALWAVNPLCSGWRSIQRQSLLNLKPWQCLVCTHNTCQLKRWSLLLNTITGLPHGNSGASRTHFWTWTWFTQTESAKRCTCLTKMETGTMTAFTTNLCRWIRLITRPNGTTNSTFTTSEVHSLI